MGIEQMEYSPPSNDERLLFQEQLLDAYRLTQPLQESVWDSRSYLKEGEQLKINAISIIQTLEDHTETNWPHNATGLVAELTKEQIDRAIQNDDYEALRPIGDFSIAWLPDIAACFASDRPLEIDVLEASLTADSLVAAKNNCLDLQKLGITGWGISKTLSTLTPIGSPHKHVITIHDITDPETGQRFTRTERYHYLKQVHRALQQTGAICLDANPGHDILIRRDSDQLKNINPLINVLRGGQLANGEGKSLYFIPYQRGVDCLRGISPARQQELLEKGVCIRNNDGTPTQAALLAAGRLLDRHHGEFMHVTVRNESQRQIQEDVFILGYGLNMDSYINHQPVTINYSAVSEELAGSVFGRLLSKHTADFLQATEAFADFTTMTPQEAEDYYIHNYEKILPEDSEIIGLITKILPKLLGPRSIGHVLNVGRGAFSYLDLALAAYFKKGSRLIGQDIAIPALDLALRVKHGCAPPAIAALGPRFESEFIKHGGNRYIGCSQAVNERVEIQHGTLSPSEFVDAIASSFYECSKDWLMSRFVKSIQDKSMTLSSRTPGLIIATHMLKRKRWGKQGQFPSTYLTIDDIKHAYKSVGLKTQIYEIETSEAGFSGMALVIAAFPKPSLIRFVVGSVIDDFYADTWGG